MKENNSSTLREVIEKAFIVNKDSIDILNSFFTNYYGGRTSHNSSRKPYFLERDIESILKRPDNFCLDIAEGLRSYPNNKYKLVCRIEELLKHLEKNHGFIIDIDIFEKFKHSTKEERLLNMLKYLHHGEKTRIDIADDFGISERALANDLKELQEGFNFMGVEMKINKLERGKNTYRSMIHPIFIAMHSAEIYAMTVGLKLLSKGTVFETTLGRIADVIHKQLSGYAQEMVDGHQEEVNIYFKEDTTKFLNSGEFMLRKKPFPYFLKEQQVCRVSYKEEGKHLNVKGTIHLSNSGLDRIIVKTEDGESIELTMDKITGLC